jgi:hypothetical protein
MKSFTWTVVQGIVAGFALLAGCAARGQVAIYSFGTTGSPTTSPTFVAAGATAGVFSGNLGTPATGSTSPLYSAGSGGAYFSASNWTGAAPGTNYFEFTVAPDAGHALSIDSLTFGYRATGTGPTFFAMRSSVDAYTTDLVTGTITGDSIWHSSGPLGIALAGLNTSTTFRIFGSGASSSLGTFRIDDVTLGGTVNAIPEPSAYGIVAGVLMLTGAALRRRRLRSAN